MTRTDRYAGTAFRAVDVHVDELRNVAATLCGLADYHHRIAGVKDRPLELLAHTLDREVEALAGELKRVTVAENVDEGDQAGTAEAAARSAELAADADTARRTQAAVDAGKADEAGAE